jgi:BirA family biotin operon repressor/biotin-[acetyl-CoA-carboxylase] ligase
LSTDLAWPKGVERRVVDSLASTYAHALELAPGLAGPTWFLAYEQTAGRGRRARAWNSPRGNLHATLMIKLAEPAHSVALRSFAAALALRDTFVTLTNMPSRFLLKWPNDVLLNGAKVAGILLESVAQPAQVMHLAIGFGVNLVAAPDLAALEVGALPAVSVFGETGLHVTPEVFLDTLAPRYAHWEVVLKTKGFAPLRLEWLAHAAKLGQTIRARTGLQSHEGVFETIDASGNLILQTAVGQIAIPAADVFFE